MLVLALVLLAAGSSAPWDAECLVRVVPVRVRLVPTPQDLSQVCRSTKRIGGCTEFRGQVLTGGCVLEGDGWRLEPRAGFIPYMFLWNPRTIWHEWSHVEDIRSSSESHLRALAGRRFPSEDACLAVASREAALFPKRMDDWKRASNTKRHGPDGPATAERREASPEGPAETAPAAP